MPGESKEGREEIQNEWLVTGRAFEPSALARMFPFGCGISISPTGDVLPIVL
jgi:hypothetical protein